MARKKIAARPAGWRAVILGACLFVGLSIGLITTFKAGADEGRKAVPAIGNGAQLEASRKSLADAYLVNCTDPHDVARFYQYLRVNIRNTRAVVRDCNGSDHLLARINGVWRTTSVNMALDARVNPTWQTTCDITDITRADDKIRPENRSIDADNLGLCKALQDNTILQPQDL
jgi:hypothetical protein